jgi:poly(beta-D-mannuronate) lyase
MGLLRALVVALAVAAVDAVPPGGVSAAPVAPPDGCLRTVAVSDTAGLSGATAGARPGDCIVLADGNYSAGVIATTGTAGNPVTISARNLGRAVFSSGNLQLRATHTVLAGITWTSGGNVRFVDCLRCRITRWTFPRRPDGTLIDFRGTRNDGNRIDHSDFGPRGQRGAYIRVRGTEPSLAKNTRIDHNHFHDIAAGPQFGEAIVLGGVGVWGDYQDTYTIVEHNLFVACDGDAEVISTKASNNIIRFNTIRRSKGMIVLRAGNRNQVYGNVILGEGKAGSGGVRVHEEDHVIYNNYAETEDPPLIVGNGTPRGPGFSHAQVFRATIVNNTFIGRTAGVQIGNAHPLPPVDMIFANNLVRTDGGRAVDLLGTPVRPVYAANILDLQGGATPGVPGPPGQFRIVDPRLIRVGELLKLANGSPAIDAAARFPFVVVDVDGQPRTIPDIGADERSTAPEAYRPLTPADVGPAAP